MDFQKISNSMQQEELDTLLIFKPENVTYLSGFRPSSLSMVVVNDDVTLYASKMELEDAEIHSKIAVKEFESFEEIKKNLKGKVGIEKSLPLYVYKKLCKNLKISLTEIVEYHRMIKNTTEIKNIKKSIEIAEKSLSEIDLTKTEFEVAAELEYNMKFNGSLRPAFETIVASGKRSSIPHATISSNTLETPVVIDWGAVHNNYCSDITRTMVKSEKEMEIFNIVLEAQQKAIKVIKPGIKASYVDKVARKVIEEYGYGDNFTHSTGHGLGLEVHENPTLSVKSDFKLKKGMVVTVEPGIYIKDQFGIRIEDDILIKNRAKVLTCMKKLID
ncbi:MAG TPA: aminopeptidase P family protein [Methanobacterium sp.]|nr:aminopeptidase P family protein [Methanobacterium sp.]